MSDLLAHLQHKLAHLALDSPTKRLTLGATAWHDQHWTVLACRNLAAYLGAAYLVSTRIRV